MTVRHNRINDVFALITAIIVVSLDQWTKSLVVEHLGPAGIGPIVPVVGQYLVLYYIRNSGAAFSIFNTNTPLLILFITIAVIVIVYLYLRMFNSGSLVYKLIFGFIFGGAVGNLLDRFLHGSVVDFIWFRIPQIGFSFAIFNLADAAISVGVVLLFIMLIFGNMREQFQMKATAQSEATLTNNVLSTKPQEHDAQS